MIAIYNTLYHNVVVDKNIRSICAVESVHNVQYFAQLIANVNNQKPLEIAVKNE